MIAKWLRRSKCANFCLRQRRSGSQKLKQPQNCSPVRVGCHFPHLLFSICDIANFLKVLWKRGVSWIIYNYHGFVDCLLLAHSPKKRSLARSSAKQSKSQSTKFSFREKRALAETWLDTAIRKYARYASSPNSRGLASLPLWQMGDWHFSRSVRSCAFFLQHCQIIDERNVSKPPSEHSSEWKALLQTCLRGLLSGIPGLPMIVWYDIYSYSLIRISSALCSSLSLRSKFGLNLALASMT